jgi:photosystem II stability/assembly factor-like uncharacterized protein
MDDISNVQRGSPIVIAGIANTACNVTTVVGNFVTLRYPTTNVIPAGTRIKFDDLAGNVVTLTTANLTANGVNTIGFTSVTGNLATHGTASTYIPTIANITTGTATLGKFSEITITEPITASIPAGGQLTFTGVITQSNAAGDSSLVISNSTKLSTGLGVFPYTTSSYTDAAANWNAVTNGTSLIITIVSTAIHGDVFPGMKVIGAGLPGSSYISDLQVTGSLTYIHLAFDTSTVSSAVDAVLTFIALPVVLDGTVITGIELNEDKNAIVSLSNPLLIDVPVKSDSLINLGLPTTQINSVSYLNNQWVAVTAGGLVINQRPGASSWNSRSALVYGDLYAVGYGNGKYVAVGSESIIVYSTDLENWSAPVFVSGASNLLRSVAYHDGVWVAVGVGGEILVSEDDALSWSLITDATDYNLQYVAYFNQWVAVGEQGTVLASDDGMTWTRYSVGVSNTINSITYVNNTYYICGTQGLIASSADVQAWDIQFANTTSNLLSFALDANQPVAVGADGTILIESQEFVVDWAIRGVAFDQINWHSVDNLAAQGYRVSDGDLLIFAQQEGFDRPNDGWNLFSAPYGGAYDSVTYDISTPVPGYYDSLASTLVANQRTGIWMVTVTDNIITLSFMRQVNLNQTVVIKNESVKLVLDPNIKPGKTVPAYSPATQSLALTLGKTTFDGQGTRFASNKDTYVEPGTLDKYLKFPKTGVFR